MECCSHLVNFSSRKCSVGTNLPVVLTKDISKQDGFILDKKRVCLMCEPGTHSSHSASHASHASHGFNVKTYLMPNDKYYYPNCSDYQPNNSTNIQQYRTVIWKVENLFALQVGMHTQNCHTLPPSLINLFKSLTRCLVYFNICIIRVTLATCSDGFNFIDESKKWTYLSAWLYLFHLIYLLIYLVFFRYCDENFVFSFPVFLSVISYLDPKFHESAKFFTI